MVYATAPLASNSSTIAPLPATTSSGGEKDSVWLAIWRTWAGFANSQLRHAPFLSLYLYMCLSALLPPWSRCSDRRKSIGPSAPIAYATSVSPPDEAVAWPRTQVSGAGYGGRLAGVEVTGGKLCCWSFVSQFLQILAHSNTHCYLRRPDHSPVPGAGRTTKKDDQQVLVVLFCLARVLSVFTLQTAICSVLERR